MVVCKFFLQGRCKFGDRCKNEHPSGMGNSQNQNQNQNQNQSQNQNSFGVFGRPNNDQSRGQPRNNSSGNQQSRNLPYHLSRAILEDDLRKERPQWIMSAYGPGRDAPLQLFGGFPVEQSPEEIRTLHYLAVATGNPQESIQAELTLANTSNQQVQAALSDLDGALQYIIGGAKTHPNRLDIVAQNSFAQQSNAPAANSGGFGQQQQQPAFGQQQPPAFGQQPPTAPGGFGQPAAPAFGGAPAPQNQPSGFGQQPMQFGQTPAFGQQPILGQNPAATPNNNSTPFGQQPQQPASGFGQPAQPSSGFGQPAQPSSGFGQSSQPASGFGQPAQSSGGFGQPAATNNVFGQPAPSNTLFGQSQPTTNGTSNTASAQPFGQASNPSQSSNANPFGASQPSNFAPPSFGGGGGGGSFSQDINSYTTHDAQNRLLTWKSRPVIYLETGEPAFRQADGSLERIWFPDGPPTKFQVEEAPEIVYHGDEEAQYRHVREHGAFEGGLMPETPPKPSDVRWDI